MLTVFGYWKVSVIITCTMMNDVTQRSGQTLWEGRRNSSMWGRLAQCPNDMASEYSPFNDYLGLAELVSRMTTSQNLTMAADEEDIMNDFHRNGRDYGLMPFVAETLDERRRGRVITSKAHTRAAPTWCVFCKNNGESEMVFASHVLKSESGKITCPILRAYTCPLCGQSGDYSHTIKYCPTTKGEVPPAPLKTARTSTGRKRTVTQSSQTTTINELFM